MDDVRDELREHGRRRREALQDARLGPEHLAVIRKAEAEGVTKVEIAKLLGVSRRSVYDLIEKEGGDG